MPSRFPWASLPDEELLEAPPQGPQGHRRRAPGWSCACATLHERAGAARPARPAARLDLQRVVQPGHHARHRHPVLSRPSAPDAARAQDDHRRRGRHGAGMHAHPAPRGRPRDAAFLSAAPPPALAGTVRPLLHPLSGLLSAESGQQELRPASAAVVRAEPSGRGFRRDLRGLAAPALRLAQALRGLAGAQEARICRRADGGDRRRAADC